MMRFRLVVLTAAMVLFAGSAAVPVFVRAAVAEAPFVRCAQRDFAGQVSCSGVIEQRGKKQVFLSAPLIAESVLVQPGDRVEEGDTLAIVDTSMTQSVLSRSVLVDQSAQGEAADTGISEDGLDKIQEAAALYGVSMEEILPLLGAQDAPGQIQGVRDGGVQTVAVPAEILAPMDGMVTEVALESGVLSQAAGPVFTIADDGRYDLRTAISETLVGSVHPGDSVSIQVAALSGRAYQGVVETVSPVARRASAAGQQAAVDVIVRILDPDDKIKDNYSASAEITSQEIRNILSLPYEAVRQERQDGREQEFVWVYEDGRARRKAVDTGEEMANCVEILSGVEEGDAVLIDSRGDLSEGKRVRLSGEGLM